MSKIILSIIAGICVTTFAIQYSVTSQPKQSPTFAPLGMDSLIAFASDREENMDIYVMHADGSNLTRLTTNDTSDMSPKWIAKTGVITFSAWRLAHEQQFLPYIINVDGSNEQLFSPIATLISAGFVDVSGVVPAPDGIHFAFVSSAKMGNKEIYIMNIEGPQTINLTTSDGNDDWPAWSPDSNYVAFTSDRSGNDDIYVMRTDGTQFRRLTHDKSGDFAPAWSPDGQRIAFGSNRHGNPGIYVMNIDGSTITALTETESGNWNASWSPDNNQIVFETDRDGNKEIYVMNADGSSPVNLTKHPSDDVLPVWSH